jgi:RNA polymerase sigma factor for flagellar operon FliA
VRNLLVEEYQRLVRRTVAGFSARLPRFIDRGDLVTAANVGLMGAIASYDPERRVRFQTYAEMRIRGAILDELRSQDWLPRPWRQRVEEKKRTLERLRADLEREPLDREVAVAMGLAVEKYELFFGVGLPGGPANTAAVRRDEPTTLDVVADPRGSPPGENLTRSELLGLMSQKMTELECRIVYLRYWEELSMREIGDLTQLSESRVYKIHTRLLERLKVRFHA